MVIEPAVCAVTFFEAMPLDAVAAPRPVTVPVPAVFAKVTEVVLSPVRTLLAASRTSAVSVRAPPELRFAVELVMVRWSAAPGSMVKVVVPEVRPAAEAVIVIEPAVCPVTALEAMPLAAVAAPSPVTVPVPAVFAKVTEVVLSPVRTLLAASRTSAVSVRAPPELEVGGRAGDGQMVGRARVDRERRCRRGQAAGGGCDGDRAGDYGRDRLGGDPARSGRRAEPGDRARAGGLRERDRGGVVAREDVVRRVPHLGGEGVRGRAGEREVVGGAGVDGEGGSAGGEAGCGGGDRDRARRLPGDGLGGDAARGGRRAEPGDGSRAGGLREGDRGGVVAGEDVVGGVAHLGGQRARAAGAEVRGRAGDREVVGRARVDGEGGSAGGEAGCGGGDR